MEELEKIAEQIQKKTKNHFCLLSDKKRTLVLINGSTKDIGTLFYRAFEKDKNVFEMIESFTRAYKMLDNVTAEDLKKILVESLDKAIKDIKKELN